MGSRYSGPRITRKGQSTQNAPSTRHPKSSLVEEESDMKRNEFEALALLRRRVKEMRANGEMNAQHVAGAATQPQEQIAEE